MPSSSPNDVNTISVSSTEIRVTWQEVEAIDRNGNITHYEVMYNGKFDDMNQSNFTDGNIQNFTITGLDEFSEYNISVRAYTSVGPGPYSQAEKEVTEEDGEVYFNHLCELCHVFLCVQFQPVHL